MGTGAENKEKNKFLLEWLQDAERSTAETQYRTVAKEDYAFYAGDQDTDAVKAILKDKDKVPSVYNEVKPKVDMLYGVASQTRHEPEVFPVGKEDEPLAELVGNSVKHYSKKIGLIDKQLDCFLHTVKSGRSLMYFFINRDNPFKPKLECKRYSGFNFYIDPDSVELDLSDARYVFIDTWLTEEEIKLYFPKIDITNVKGGGQSTDTPSFFNEANDKYRIVEGWYYKMRKVIWFQNPMTGKMEWLSKADYGKYVAELAAGVPVGVDAQGETIEQKFDEPVNAPGFKKIYYYSLFSGHVILGEGPSPHNYEGFPMSLYGAYRDDDNNSLFGAITMMKDPQRAKNDMRRQISSQLKTLPKGMLKHEVGAVTNIDEYEKRSTDANFHLEIMKGQFEKVGFQEQPSIPPIYKEFDAMSSQSMKDASGIQDPLMSVQTSSREPGVALRMRQETGVVVLYILFDNFRKSRIKDSKILLSFMQQYSTDAEMIRIQGEKGMQLVEINSQMNPQVSGWNDITIGEYDIEIGETIETISMRSGIAQMLGDFAHNNPGSIPPEVFLDYAGLPFSVKQQVTAYHQAQRDAEAAQADHQRKMDEREMKLKEREVDIKAREVEAKIIQAKKQTKTKE